MFINPSSHKKEAVHIYREHVAPLFKMADVRTDITGQSIDFFFLIYYIISYINLYYRVTVGGLQTMFVTCMVIKLFIRAVRSVAEKMT